MAKEDKKIDFESSLKKLGSIVEKLEDENINLEDSVKSFEEGMNLVKKCHILLHEQGTKRIFTSLKIGTRVDKEQTMEDKVNVVEQKLNRDGKKK